jgi:hypothetical protein
MENKKGKLTLSVLSLIIRISSYLFSASASTAIESSARFSSLPALCWWR